MFGINKAYCLCLDKRKEHWLDLKQQCESKGLEFNRFLVGDGKTLEASEYNRIDVKELPQKFNWHYGGHKTDTFEQVTRKITHHYNAFLSHQESKGQILLKGFSER